VIALFKKNLFLQILFTLHLIANLVLLLLPLTKYFSFEFATLNSLFVVIFAGLFTIREDKFKSSSLAVKVFNVKFLLFGILFLLIPVLLAFVFHLFRRDCSFIDGFKFYAVITVPAVVIGYALGLLSEFISKKLVYLVFVLLLFVIAVVPILEIFFRPQIYFFNPLIPFFPGTMYDEDIDVNGILILYRVCNLLFFGGIIYCLRGYYFKKFKIGKKWLIGAAALIACGFIYASPYIGFATNTMTLRNILSKEVSTAHFTIYLPESVSVQESNYIKNLHEFYYARISKYLKTHPAQKIISFVFANKDEKRKYFGAGNADVAKPWLGQIYLSLDSYEFTVNHELGHIFAGTWSKNILKVDANYNPATVEGIASAVDPLYDDYDIHYLAFQAMNIGDGLNIANLFSNYSFFTGISSLSYITSGSFCQYLIQKYGVDTFKKYFSDGDFESSYRRTLAQEADSYKKYLLSKEYKVKTFTADYYYGRLSLVQKICPRYMANKTKEIFTLIEAKNYSKAENEITSIPQYQKNYGLFSGLEFCLENKNPKQAETLLQENLFSYKRTPYYFLLLLKFADVKVKNGDEVGAQKILDSLQSFSPTAKIDSRVKLRLLLQKNHFLREYITGKEIDRIALLQKLFDASPSPQYLLPIIDAVEKGSLDYKRLSSNIYSISAENMNDDWNSVLQLLRIAIQHEDFSAAEHLLKETSSKFPPEADESLIIEKDKLEWFVQNDKRNK